MCQYLIFYDLDYGHEENQCYDGEAKGGLMMTMWRTLIMLITMRITLDHDDEEGHYFDHCCYISHCPFL